MQNLEKVSLKFISIEIKNSPFRGFYFYSYFKLKAHRRGTILSKKENKNRFISRQKLDIHKQSNP